MQKQIFSNWSNNIQFDTSRIEYPANDQELKRLIKTNSKVHIGGTFHCFNDLANTDGLIISLKKMNKICTKCPKTVLIEAGVTYSDLRKKLMEVDRAIINFPSLPHLNIIGSMVTGTHGGAKNIRIMADLVQEYEIMDGRGYTRVMTRSDPLFFKLLVGLGFLGVIIRARLSTVKSFALQKSIYSKINFQKFKELGTKIFEISEYTSLFIDLDSKHVSSIWFAKKITSDSNKGIPY
jgi:xylitol oxidase